TREVIGHRGTASVTESSSGSTIGRGRGRGRAHGHVRGFGFGRDPGVDKLHTGS
ncbi:hypothetical protein LPJ66_010159, partial [Kickxella alabastrina]